MQVYKIESMMFYFASFCFSASSIFLKWTLIAIIFLLRTAFIVSHRFCVHCCLLPEIVYYFPRFFSITLDFHGYAVKFTVIAKFSVVSSSFSWFLFSLWSFPVVNMWWFQFSHIYLSRLCGLVSDLFFEKVACAIAYPGIVIY